MEKAEVEEFTKETSKGSDIKGFISDEAMQASDEVEERPATTEYTVDGVK